MKNREIFVLDMGGTPQPAKEGQAAAAAVCVAMKLCFFSLFRAPSAPLGSAPCICFVFRFLYTVDDSRNMFDRCDGYLVVFTAGIWIPHGIDCQVSHRHLDISWYLSYHSGNLEWRHFFCLCFFGRVDRFEGSITDPSEASWPVIVWSRRSFPVELFMACKQTGIARCVLP